MKTRDLPDGLFRRKEKNEADMTCTVIRSNRRTLALRVLPDGTVEARAPLYMPQSEIRRFLKEKESWILAMRAKAQQQAEAAEQAGYLSDEDIRRLAEAAKKAIPERVRYYAPLIGVTYGRITIRNQRSKWGSCSAKGNLNFNCLLMLAPPEVLDSVVVHELCHRKQMNHSPKFYAEVYRAFPEYDRWNRWLKQHGAELMARMQ